MVRRGQLDVKDDKYAAWVCKTVRRLGSER